MRNTLPATRNTRAAKGLFQWAVGALERLRITRQVKRLAPWYYSFDLKGVSTTITQPCDHHGHRTVSLPPGTEALFQEKTILDVGCNEGGYTFAAIQHGAGPIDAFDCRSLNVEKARLVAKILDYRNVTFHVASCDSWLRENARSYDFVFLCGILYHLPEPWRIIRDYCALAREGLFVTSVLHGGEDGYSPFSEAENIAASSDPDEVSQMPNTSNTLLKEFARHGFYPTHIFEKRVADGHDLWGGCGLVLKNCGQWLACEPRTVGGTAPERFGVYFVPSDEMRPVGRERPLDVAVVVCNREATLRRVDLQLLVRAADGTVLRKLDPQELRFIEGEPDDPFGRRSCTVHPRLDAPTASGKVVLQADVVDSVSGHSLSSSSLVVEASSSKRV